MKRNGHVTLLWEDTDYLILKGKQMFFSFGREASNTKQHGNKPGLILVWIFSTVVKTRDTRFFGKVSLLLKKNLHGWEKGQLYGRQVPPWVWSKGSSLTSWFKWQLERKRWFEPGEKREEGEEEEEAINPRITEKQVTAAYETL